MKILLTRHGETIANTMNKIQGLEDTPLTAKGFHQASVLVNKLSGFKFDAIYTSDLGRCLQTTTFIAKHHEGVPVIEIAALRERDLACLVGRSAESVDWDNLTDDVETAEQVTSRISSFIDSLLEKGHGNVLVVTHNGTLKAFLRALNERGTDFTEEYIRAYNTPNSAIHEIDLEADSVDIKLEAF